MQDVRTKAQGAMNKAQADNRPRDEVAQGETTYLKTRKLDKLIEHLQGIKETQFTGYIKINFSQGHIGRIEKFEEILKS